VVRDDKRHLDVYIYDNVPGGAGLVTQLNDQSEIIGNILEDVIVRLGGEKCSNAKPCDRVCTGCLLDFRNIYDQDLLNRPLGLQLALYLKDGVIPSPDRTALNVTRSVLADHVTDLNNFFEDLNLTLENEDIVIEKENEAFRVTVFSSIVEKNEQLPLLTDGQSPHCQIDYYQSKELISLYQVFSEGNVGNWGTW
jgi:hypothetical protein